MTQTLRMTAAAPAYWDYLRKKRNWTQADVQTIHWTSFRLALASLQSNDQRRIILLIHQKLPLRSSQFHPHMGSKLCPSCQRELEDAGHFLACQHPERRQQFELLRKQLLTISLKYDLHPGVLTSFWLGLATVRNTTPYPAINDELPIELRPSLRYQQRLGWDQLFYGRVAKQWVQAIDQLHPHIAISGAQVMTKFTQAVWKYVLATWTIRNQHLHHDAGRLSTPDYQQAVRTLYELGEQLPPDARTALFRYPLQHMLEQPPAVLRPWLERGYKYLRQQLKAAKARARINTHDIRSFFRNTSQSANDLLPP